MDDQYRPSRFQILPPVVKNLLIINGLMFLASIVFENVFHYDLAQKLGLYYFGSPDFHPYQIITHLFMHGSFMHIFSNMLSLWMFGNVLENYWGPKKFLTFYMITGLGAALMHSLVSYYNIHAFQTAIDVYNMHPGVSNFTLLVKDNLPEVYNTAQIQNFISAWVKEPSNFQFAESSKVLAQQLIDYKMSVPTVGASGAVFGLLTAFGLLFPNTVIYLYFAIPLKAKYFVILYGLFELYSGIQNDPTDNVAHFAHLGGALFGFILIKLWYKPKRNEFY